jgi:Hypothetical protein (DUF2513)
MRAGLVLIPKVCRFATPLPRCVFLVMSLRLVQNKGRDRSRPLINTALLWTLPLKRDMDLIRELLLRLEALPIRRGGIVTICPETDELAVPGYDADQIDHHLFLIREADLIRPQEPPTFGGVMFSRLSWEGCDFLDSIRDPEVWAKTKKSAEVAGGFTFDLLKDLAKGFIKTKIEEHTGVKL